MTSLRFSYLVLPAIANGSSPILLLIVNWPPWSKTARLLLTVNGFVDRKSCEVIPGAEGKSACKPTCMLICVTFPDKGCTGQRVSVVTCALSEASQRLCEVITARKDRSHPAPAPDAIRTARKTDAAGLMTWAWRTHGRWRRRGSRVSLLWVDDIGAPACCQPSQSLADPARLP